MDTILVKYVKNRGNTVGCVVAKKLPHADSIFISGSLCWRNVDKFCKNTAINIAEERVELMANTNRICPLPYSLLNDVQYMVDRAKRYFKTDKIIVPPLKDFSGQIVNVSI